MNREKAIDLLDDIIGMVKANRQSDYDTALKMAIQALSQEPTDENLHREREQAYMQGYEDASKRFRPEPCDDAVSREMALKECYDIVAGGERYRVIQEETLLGLPPVTQKSGKWITEEIGEGRKVYCSECKESAVFEYVRDGDIYSSYGHGVVKKTKYCPNCGAEMVGEEE